MTDKEKQEQEDIEGRIYEAEVELAFLKYLKASWELDSEQGGKHEKGT